jgi:adenylate kinase family enzyme
MLSAEVARRLGVPHIELDALHHGPDWSAPDAVEFRDLVRQAMDAAPNGWVIDGNYDGMLGDLVTDAADTIVWLDFPLWVIYPRLLRRTFYRVRHRVELWNGNRETWRNSFLSRDSVLLAMIRSHRRHRREWPVRFGQDPRLVVFRSDAEVRRWLDEQADRLGAAAIRR